MSKFEIDNFVKNEKLKIIEALQKEHLDFELDETQIEALLKVIEIITKDEFDFVTLSGSAGTGNILKYSKFILYL